MLKIYNSLSAKKEEFIPIRPGKVSMYVCGMTVYDFCHIGHARVLVVFDIVSRYFRHIYGKENVTYVRNVTDIDDKIIQRANENNEHFLELTRRFTDAMHEDSEALGILPPDIEPKATEHMPQILNMIKTLVDKGIAYQADSSSSQNNLSQNNDVFYQIDKFQEYGKLSKKNLDELQAGRRVGVEEAKRNPLDFVLWKAAKENEPSWDSPWGKGRPGWHIECSAMSTHCLHEHFDLHGGGLDLQFPHHENEIAQSEACTDQKFVNYWMHNGFVKIDDEKMSKSLGNFFIIRDVLKVYAPEVIRYFILNSHYRSALNYSDDNLDKAKASLSSLYNTLIGFDDDDLTNESSKEQINDDNAYSKSFFKAMDDDFNTPKAIAVLFEITHDIHKASDQNKKLKLAIRLKHLAGFLGLLQQSAESFLQSGVGDDGQLSAEKIEQLIQDRATAKADKNWAECDRIRDLLQADGVILEDGPEGTRWRR
ncbi:MAG: cysteine--tRNA ligase [Gammaproteobacteria bacterium]|nr:cysteine--tRNA ligase [Gammaproteobacteria bacterium]